MHAQITRPHLERRQSTERSGEPQMQNLTLTHMPSDVRAQFAIAVANPTRQLVVSQGRQAYVA